MVYWRYISPVVAAEFRNVHVPFLARACDKTEGMQETLLYTITEEQYMSLPLSYRSIVTDAAHRSSERPEEYETTSRPSLRTI